MALAAVALGVLWPMLHPARHIIQAGLFGPVTLKATPSSSAAAPPRGDEPLLSPLTPPPSAVAPPTKPLTPPAAPAGPPAPKVQLLAYA